MFDDILSNVLNESNIEAPGPGGAGIAWLISTAVNVVTAIAFGVSFVMLAYSFILFITSTGDPKRVEKPKNAVTWSIVGLILSLALQGIKAVILSTLGYDSDLFF